MLAVVFHNFPMDYRKFHFHTSKKGIVAPPEALPQLDGAEMKYKRANENHSSEEVMKSWTLDTWLRAMLIQLNDSQHGKFPATLLLK